MGLSPNLWRLTCSGVFSQIFGEGLLFEYTGIGLKPGAMELAWQEVGLQYESAESGLRLGSAEVSQGLSP